MNFKDPEIWKKYDPANQAKERLAAIKSFIPGNVASILDAGCGNGIISNSLLDEYNITGIDSSAEALKYVKCRNLQASVTQIPFPDNSFDLVMCNEVLEHLDNHSLMQVINELKRVANKYILISVPHREQLGSLFYRCADCGYTGHAYGHLQSFSLESLNKLFAKEFKYTRYLVFGPQTRDFIPFLLHLKKHTFHQWFRPFPECRCSQCNSSHFQASKSIFTKAINLLNIMLSPGRPFWLMVLYSREKQT